MSTSPVLIEVARGQALSDLDAIPAPTVQLPLQPMRLDALEAVEAWLRAKPPFEIVGVARSSRACVLHTYLREQGVPIQVVSRFHFSYNDDAGERCTRHLSFALYCFITMVDEYDDGYALTAQEALDCIERSRVHAEECLAAGWGF